MMDKNKLIEWLLLEGIMKKISIILVIVMMVIMTGCNIIIPTTRGLVAPVDDNFVYRACPELACAEYKTPPYEQMVVVGVAWGEWVSGSPLWWVLAVQSRLLYVPINRFEFICFEGSCNDD